MVIQGPKIMFRVYRGCLAITFTSQDWPLYLLQSSWMFHYHHHISLSTCEANHISLGHANFLHMQSWNKYSNNEIMWLNAFQKCSNRYYMVNSLFQKSNSRPFPNFFQTFSPIFKTFGIKINIIRLRWWSTTRQCCV